MNNSPQSRLDSLKKLRKEYSDTVPSKLKELEQLIDEMRVTINEETLKTFRLKVHKIAGNAGTFGFTNVSTLSGKMDESLSERLEGFKSSGPNQNWIDEFDSFLEELKQAFSKENL